MTASGIEGISLHSGVACGRVLQLDPLSFWGGTDLAGTITDRHHRLRGTSISGRVMVMRAGRGSSSSSSVLAEQLRAGVGPAAIVLTEPDQIIVTGAIVVAELYRHWMPIVQLSADAFDSLPDGQLIEVHAGQETAWLRLLT